MKVDQSASNGTSAQEQREARFFNVFKYRNTLRSIDASAPDTRGPNRGCPTPIVPLTSNENSILTRRRGCSHWNGGGTNQAEGLAWGWRVLRHGAYREGVPYNPPGDVRKVIVLMSDGENTNVGNDAVVASSDYSAYSHLRLWRDYAGGDLSANRCLGVLHGVLPSQYRRNINSRATTSPTSTGARRSSAPTSRPASKLPSDLRETDTATENMMRTCATSPEHFYRADNASSSREPSTQSAPASASYG